MDCNLAANKKKCACTYTSCNKKGRCCECLSYHWKHGELPACLFPPEVEKTYDRSLKKFLEIYSKQR